MSTSNKFAIDTEQRFNDGGDIRALFEQEESPVSMRFVLAILNSELGEFYHKNTAKLKRDGYYEYYGNALDGFPIFQLSAASDSPPEADDAIQQTEGYIDGHRDMIPWIESRKAELSEHGAVVHELLTTLSEQMRQLRETRFALNLHLPDYLGAYDFGSSLGEIPGYQPPAGVSDSILSDTAEDRDGVRIGQVKVDSANGEITIEATARYKPENPDEHETDRWGYTETEYIPAIRFRGLDDAQEALISAFVEYAVNEEDDGFAGFYSKATKSNSLIDRLGDLTLPAMDDVETGLNRYLNNLEEAHRLDSRIERVDNVMNDVVYSLYGLDEEEIRRVKDFMSDGRL